MQPNMNPVAQSLAGQGRYGDSMLVHMNPQEVAGLQALAMRQGGSLTVNPETGLPEAFNLSSILPVIAGAALTPIMGPVGAAMAVGGIGTLMSGSIEQGLMMGLGAYGGAGLAGSAANLASPAAAAASAAPSAAIAAPAAVGGAAGAPGVLASAAPATTLAGATQFAPAASVGGLSFQAPALSTLAPITPATTAAAGSSLVPTATGGISATVNPSLQATAPFATTEPISNIIPTPTPSSVSPPSGIGRLFQPDERTSYENIGAGLKKAFSSGESAMDFLGQNKMNLAMSAAPMLFSPEEEAEIQRQRAMIRPYEYQVDNLSGAPVDPFGTEAERLRGRFVAKTPYYAAKGGLMSFAEGGSTTTTTAPATTAPATTTTPAASTTPTLTPAEADVYRNIFAVQQLAGMPMGIPTAPVTPVTPVTPPGGIGALPPSLFMPYQPTPRAPVAYTPSMVGTTSTLDTSEKRYGATPTTGSVISKDSSGGGDFVSSLPLEPESFGLFVARAMGGTNSPSLRVRQNTKNMEPRRIVGYTGDGQPVYLASDAKGGTATSASSNKFSYDPATGTYKQLAEGGSVPSAFNEGGIASLRENDFILPADVISHMGNGSSDAGMEIAITQFKARPIKGKGDGMSDSIPTSIEGKQKALVAHEEALIPREMVAFLGGGSVQKGAAKLEKFMDRVRKARTGKKKQAPEIDVSRYMPT